MPEARGIVVIFKNGKELMERLSKDLNTDKKKINPTNH